MAQRDETASPVAQEERHSLSASEASRETDTFEDATEAASVRSLTKRTVSASRSSPSPPDEPAGNDDANSRSSTPNGNRRHSDLDAESVDRQPESPATSERPNSQAKPSSISNRISSTSNLDNVNLDDDAPQSVEEPKSPIEKGQPSKTISLSSITSALPSMPWSPSSESPSRSPNPGANAVAPPPPPPPASQPAPPARKLTSPFSWLSRSASKDKDKDTSTATSAHTSPRRNTASSIATLTSNPEMMLSRLEEEKEGDDKPANGTNRDSLRDRFKLLRMREEAGITPSLADDDQSDNALATLARSHAAAINLSAPGEETAGSDAPLPSPRPDSNGSLAPGTVSGVNAGPSAMPESQVDWDLWQSVVYEGPAAVARTSAEELNRAIATGIPSAIRGVIWQVLAQSKNDDLERVYKDLIVRGTNKEKDRHSNSTAGSSSSHGNQAGANGETLTSSSSSVHSELSGGNGQASPQHEKNAELALKTQALSAAERARQKKEDAATLQKLEKTIRRDLGARTSYSKYAASAGLQDGLFGVCKAYALYDEGVGYAQGMNFLIMPFLFNMPEQEAFCLLVRLMHHYGLRDLFIQDMPGLHMRLYQFERLLEDFEPALYCHLHRRGISPHLYATQWFLTLFAYRFPLQLVLRIYDLIFSEGLSAVLRFGIVLMQKNASTLLEMSDMQQLTVYLKDKLFDYYIDKDPSQGSLLESGFFGSSSSNMEKEVYRADQLIRDACEVKITPESLKAYTIEWEEKTKAEKDRETELHELRSTNQHLSQKVRKLEESVEICDREQAALATELVHTKVQNEELKDENESLNGQVRELRVVIEKQPLEIEQAWQLERDDLMKRNEKVHEENRELEKNLSELEEQLVQTKMRYAEINSQHETLNRKWTDLKRQFA